MRNYTNIEQSKKLAEILPIESADMFYTLIDQGLYLEVKQGIEPSKDDIPAWSLAALLALLPKEINVLGTIYSIDIHTKNEEWFIDYKCNNEEFVGVYSNILVDACFEMIVKLHEQKLL